MDLAFRFINAYNEVDNRLRAIFNFSDKMSFGDVVRRSAQLSSAVRRYEDDLFSYGRLRNAIVHDSYSDEVIAEPHVNVVENFEKIARILSVPPKAVDVSASQKVTTIDGKELLINAIDLMYKSGYSVLPIMNGEEILGVFHTKLIVNAVGAMLEMKVDVETGVGKIKVESLVKPQDKGSVYVILDENSSLFDVLDAYEKNKKLRAVIINKNGGNKGRPVKIFTPVDTTAIIKIMENY